MGRDEQSWYARKTKGHRGCRPYPMLPEAIIADTPLRKVYVTPGSNALWFYCDGASARELHSRLDAAGPFPIELL